MIFIAKMKGFEYYIRIGKESFDLKDTELRQWVSGQMKLDQQHELELARAKEEERKHEAAEAEKVRQHELKILDAKHEIIKCLLERDITDTVSILEKFDSFFQAHPDKQLAKPLSTASYDDSQSTQYQKRAGRASRGNRGNYSFSGKRGRGNGDWRSGNTQQSGGRGTYNPPDSRICYHCREKGHIKVNCFKWNAWLKERLEAIGRSLQLNVNQDPCFHCQTPDHTAMDCYKLKHILWNLEDDVRQGNAATVPDISDTARDQHVYPGILIKGKGKSQ